MRPLTTPFLRCLSAKNEGPRERYANEQRRKPAQRATACSPGRVREPWGRHDRDPWGRHDCEPWGRHDCDPFRLRKDASPPAVDST